MLLIVMLHVNFFSIESPKVDDFSNSFLSSFVRVEFEALAIVGVNVFVLISGWFGINLKVRGVCEFLFQVLFWGVVLYALSIVVGLEDFYFGTFAKFFIPGKFYWFVLAYLLLMLFSPVLNSYINTCGKKQLRNFLVWFYVLQTLFGWVEPLWSIYVAGYSTVSFIGLYLLARYISVYRPKFSEYKIASYMWLFLLVSTIPAIIASVVVAFVPYDFIVARAYPWMMSYCSPFVVVGSVCLILAFNKMKFQKSWINWIAASTFSVYLMHLHPSISPYFRATSIAIFEHYSGIVYLSIALMYILAVFITCILLDKIRIAVWKLVDRKIKITLVIAKIKNY